MKISMKLFLLTAFILCIHNIQNSSAVIKTIGNVAKSAKDLTAGAVSKIPNILPSPTVLLRTSINLLAGYPFSYVTSAINEVCSAALSSSKIEPKYSPNIYKMSFVLITPTSNYSFPLINAEEMWLSPAFSKDKNTVILITGWQTDLNDTNGAIYTLSKAFLCRGNVNFVVLDSGHYVDTLYTWSAFNTEEIGQYVGEAIVLLSKYCDINKLQIIGHSLGAHISGSAGRKFYKYSGKKLPHITGLDPAKPCFNEGEALSGLQRGDAEFIDIIHSNPGVLGKKESIGDIDFYPGGFNPLPPGCFSASCAHSRAWEYYAETVIPGNEDNFWAIRCSSIAKVREGVCQGETARMGYSVQNDKKGDYFLEVNSKYPYGLNATTHEIRCNDPTIIYK